MFIKRVTVGLAFCVLIGAGSLTAALAEVITLNGHKVYTERVMAKLKKGAAGANGLRALSAPGADGIKTFDAIPGLVALTRNAGLRAAGARTEEEKAAELQQWIEELRATGQFEYVGPDYQLRANATPTDRRFVDGTLWGLRNTGQFGGVPGADIGVTNAWDLTTGSTDVVVAVIDSGIRYTHQDLAAQMWVNPGEIAGNGADDDNDGYIDNIFGIDPVNNDGDPNDDDGHGTHVAGTIGAAANDGNEHVGVVWRVRMMALKTLGANQAGSTADALECINFAVRHRVHVINASWGGGSFDPALYDAILAARDANILFVASAGNDFNDNDRFPSYPASFDLDNIISVAALDRADRLAVFSNYGRNSVDIGAPGVAIYSTWWTSDSAYMELDGTSQAAPHVAGVAALVKAYVPGAGYAEIRARILDGAVPIPVLATRVATGGRLNAFRALTRGIDGLIELSITPPDGALVTVGSDVVFTVVASDGLPLTNATITARTLYAGGTNLTLQYVPPGTNGPVQDGTYTAIYRVPDQPGDITFTFDTSAPGKTNRTDTLTYTAVERPANDMFTNAVKVAATGGRFEQSWDFASREDLSGEPNHGDFNGTLGGTVWYSWSLPPSNGRTNIPVLIDTAGTPADTLIAVYTGSSLAEEDLELVTAVNDVGTLRQAWLKFVAQAGVSYKIAIATSEAVDRPGTLKLRFEIDGEPDTRTPFVQITDPPSGIIVRTNRIIVSGVSFDPQPNASGIADVQILVNDREQVRAEGTTNWVAPFPLLLDFGINIIRVIAFDEAQNQSQPVQINVTYQEDASASDLFARATELRAGESPRNVSSASATKESNEPQHAGNTGGKSVWFYYRPTQDGVLLLSTEGSNFDTLLAVYTGTNVTQLTEVASNDDTPAGSKQSEVTFGVRAGEIYNIAVDGYDGSSGDVQLNFSFTPVPVFAIRALSADGGRVNPSFGYFPSNSTVSIIATPSAGFEFAEFVDQTSGEVIRENPLTFAVARDLTVRPVFRAQQYVEDFEGGTFRLPFQARGWALGGDPEGGNNRVAISQETRETRNVTNTLSLLTRTISGIGSFEFGVSSEPNYDRLEFWVTYYSNGQPGQPTMLGRWSGEAPRTLFQFETREDLALLEWRYIKDAAISQGRDMAYIDNLELDLSEAEGDRRPVTVSAVGDSLRLSASGTPGSTVVIEASSDLQRWVALPPVEVNANGQAVVLQPIKAGRQFYRLR